MSPPSPDSAEENSAASAGKTSTSKPLNYAWSKPSPPQTADHTSAHPNPTNQDAPSASTPQPSNASEINKPASTTCATLQARTGPIAGLVFTNATGDHLHPDNVSHDFSAAVHEVEYLTRFSIHGLRHTHATHLLAAGINAKIVADRLGHHSVAFTLDTYTHAMPGQHAEAAAAVAALIAKREA